MSVVVSSSFIHLVGEGGGGEEEVLRAKRDGNEEMRGTEQDKQKKLRR
jgi:hypothetical protein